MSNMEKKIYSVHMQINNEIGLTEIREHLIISVTTDLKRAIAMVDKEAENHVDEGFREVILYINEHDDGSSFTNGDEEDAIYCKIVINGEVLTRK